MALKGVRRSWGACEQMRGNRNAAGPHKSHRDKGSTKRPFTHRRNTIPPEVRWRICSAGGKAAWLNGKAHRWTSAQAKAAAEKSLITRKLKQRLKAILNG